MRSLLCFGLRDCSCQFPFLLPGGRNPRPARPAASRLHPARRCLCNTVLRATVTMPREQVRPRLRSRSNHPTSLRWPKGNHGKFPYDQVSKAITGDFEVPAHGSREMPMWGPLFLALTGENAREAERLTTNLTDYIKSIQVK